MRPLIPLVAAALLAAPAGAQTPRVTRAFERAVTPWLGFRHYGDRAWSPLFGDARFSPSLALGAMLDLPLTRRTGFIADVHVAPLGKQELAQEDARIQNDRAFTYSASAALAGRLRPQAPIFFFAGAALAGSNTGAMPDGGGSILPGATAGVGLDLARLERVGVRVVYQAYLLKPSDPDVAGYEAESMAVDWTLGLGGRIAIGREGAAR